MTDTVNVKREWLKRIAGWLISSLKDGLGPDEVHHALCDADYAKSLLAAAPKAEPFDELKPNDIAAIIEQNADYDENGLYNASQLAEKIYRAFRDQPEAPKVEQEPFGHWVEHTVGEPVFIRNGSYVPKGENYTVTPLYTRPAPASDELLEALAPFARYYDLNDCHERRPDDALEVPIYDLTRAAELYAKHKGPQS